MLESRNVLALGIILICLRSIAESKRAKYECPFPGEIHPCTCSPGGHGVVQCNVKSVDIVQKALDDIFSYPPHTLKISQLDMHELPQRAFGLVSPSKIYITNSTIGHVHEDAFEGQDSLSSLVFADSELRAFPSIILKHLPRLKTLSLSGNFLTEIGVESISNQAKLVHIILSHKIFVMDNCSFPETLRSLVLTGNFLTTLNGAVKHLANLDALFVDHNHLLSVKGDLNGLPKLNVLVLAGNYISDISGSFDELTSLIHLNLGYNSLESLGSGLRSLRNLMHLNLTHNRVSELGENAFRHMKGMKILDLSKNRIRNVCPSLHYLTNLELLRMSEMKLKNLDYDCFSEMKMLRDLDLSRNELTHMIAVTGNWLPRLHRLFLQYNRLDMMNYGFKNLRQLRYLDVSSNNIGSILGYPFAFNTVLETFHAGGNPWECTEDVALTFKTLRSVEVEISGAPPCF